MSQTELKGIKASDKPPYRVPTMEEVHAVPENGVMVASLFAGAGGSCIGYRIAGCRVAWANEFLEAAARVHEANFPDCLLDRRDVREIQPEEVLKVLSMVEGELDVLDGSPPCQPFSSAGRREKTWGKKRKQSDGTDQRSDDLTFEFTRLLRGIQPRTFIVENVAGMARGKAKGYFLRALKEMRAAGYQVEARILDAQWLGVPQTRARLIYVGVRDDLGRQPAFPTPLSYRYSVREAIPWIIGLEEPSGFTGHPTGRVVHDTKGHFTPNGPVEITDRPCPAITIGAYSANLGHFIIERGLPLGDSAVGREWDKLKPGDQSDKYRNLIKPHLDAPSPCVTAIGGTSGGIASVTHPVERRKFTILELKRICSFPDDFDLLDLTYAEQWARLGNSVPPLMMRAIARAVIDGCLA